ncbi:MAG: S-methyl-5-thioribose-1-phosphate isomerase [Acidobacteria bacterium]|nr:MAG: S-methyl-5-thioribose-1-phosphate isomerase [Acidobacteriota bacterium]REJ99632.1 MAG: S-methyl-5-thioribose-1-phosphate isomerase [Acidobacteriota bacterium]
MASDFSPLRWSDGAIEILDQTLLPREEKWLRCTEPQQVAEAIRRLSVRGAPAIGVAAAYGLVVAVAQGGAEAFAPAYDLLLATRPTAVNLRWALEQGQQIHDAGPEELETALLAWAQELHRRDAEINRAIGEHSVRLFAPGDRVLTHCNAGALATAGYGTAVGVIRSAWTAGALAAVWVDETRPLLQGARLTAWELQKLEIPFRIVTDNSVGALMSRGHVDKVVVGADRIAANGDVANKIGTYTVAVMAQRHGVPFYVAAPRSTIDPRTATGAEIPIEERDALEVTEVFGTRVAPLEAPALNIAFDVTPAELVAGIITEVGVLEPPYEESIAAALSRP